MVLKVLSTSVYTSLNAFKFTGIALQPLFKTECSETTAHSSGDFDNDMSVYRTVL
jgi:hypothetical protein